MFWQRGLLKHYPKIAYFCGVKGSIAKVNGIEIWHECFGKKSDPAFLLLTGAGCQGIVWNDSFCQNLAAKGFFVIRFDYRDTGFSSYCNYKKTPYTLMDLALDSTGLLDFLGIFKAHILGISMGGALAQILASYFSERVLSMTLIATTNDFRPLAAVMRKNQTEKFPLSSPDERWFKWIEELDSLPKWAFFQKVEKYLEGWEILNGAVLPFERSYYQDLMRKSIRRQRSYKALLNHRFVLLNSLDLIESTQGKIQRPTFIVQGGQDPLFSKDHGHHLAESIPRSSLLILEDMGHNFNRCFHDTVLNKVISFIEGEKLLSKLEGKVRIL